MAAHPPFKIALTGPESTGKTTLAAALARHLGTLWVPEVARAYLPALGRPYAEADLDEIARRQAAAERRYARRLPHGAPLICDTDMTVLLVWATERYGQPSARLARRFAQTPYDLHLLCAPDLPWTPDPLREHPQPADRHRLFDHYRSLLLRHQRPFRVVSGQGAGRLACALGWVERRLLVSAATAGH